VKKTLLLIIPLFYLNYCFAQDTVERKNRLSDSVIERFFVLKSDKKTKEGPYRALFQRRIVVAQGHYHKDKKSGVWNFYNQTGHLVETYDYGIQQFTYEAPVLVSDDFSYAIDDTIKKTDKVRRPLKIGGVYYGFIPYLTIFQTPFDTFEVNTDSFDAYVELLISPLGRLADYKVRLVSKEYQYDHIINLDVHLFNEEERTFVPANFNGKPVLSRILIKCWVTPNGGIDFY